MKIELPLSRLGRVAQFVGFALVMSLALLALATATQMLAWGWRYIAVQVHTGWQRLTAFQPDLIFVKKFTRPDFQAKNFTHYKCKKITIFTEETG